MNVRKLLIGFPLVHLLLDPTTPLNRIRDIFLELLIRRSTPWMQDLQEGTQRLLDALFISAFHRAAQTHALADFLVAIGVTELIMKGLGQVVGDEPVVIRQVLTAVLWHLPTRQIAGQPVHHSQVKLWWQRLEQVILR